MNAVIVIPTYNERENIGRLIDTIFQQQTRIQYATLSVLIVDDSSPDKTAEIVTEKQREYPHLYLLSGKKEGLGKAYLRGFDQAIKVLKADVVFEMDADFSHNPADIPVLLDEIKKGKSFVIGSRYIPGGSIPKEWGTLRKLNSKFGNILARYIAGLSNVNDCTGGFRAIRTSLLKKIDLSTLNVSGYAFQISLLQRSLKLGAEVKEVPIQFIDREFGKSKIRIKDILEFLMISFKLRLSSISFINSFTITLSLLFLVGILSLGVVLHVVTLAMIILFLIVFFAIFMVAQSIVALMMMIYTWENPELHEQNQPLESFARPRHTFTILIPARHEEKVIGQTIRTMSELNYPSSLYEVLVICREDDTETIEVVKKSLQELNRKSFSLVTFSDLPINKPHALNIGLKKAKNEIVTVFDAEDEPHEDILHVMNTTFQRETIDVIQGGVQLMNYRSSWYAAFNVLEYYFWFKSTLHFFSKRGFIPLGGNTVFIKRRLLHRLGGWDDNCLTEDAEIGVRFSSQNIPVKVLYQALYTTREETPHSLASFIKQRTRWNQGFIQVLRKGDWLKLPRLSQKLLACYILGWPIIQAVFFLFIPLSFLVAFIMKLPLIITLLTLLPMYLLVLHLITQIIALHEFTSEYHLPFSLRVLLRSLVTFYLFQVLLGLSAVRAVYRVIRGDTSWEKTVHLNTHRHIDSFTPLYVQLANS